MKINKNPRLKSWISSKQPSEDGLIMHGSRRGAACMMGGTVGWFLGTILVTLTQQIHWLIVMPAIGILLGELFGRWIYSKKKPASLGSLI